MLSQTWADGAMLRMSLPRPNVSRQPVNWAPWLWCGLLLFIKEPIVDWIR